MAQVKMYQLTQKEKEMIVIGLQMRRAYIETGDACLTAETAVKTGRQEMIKPLSVDQMRLIVATDELIQKLYR